MRLDPLDSPSSADPNQFPGGFDYKTYRESKKRTQLAFNLNKGGAQYFQALVS